MTDPVGVGLIAVECPIRSITCMSDVQVAASAASRGARIGGTQVRRVTLSSVSATHLEAAWTPSDRLMPAR